MFLWMSLRVRLSDILAIRRIHSRGSSGHAPAPTTVVMTEREGCSTDTEGPKGLSTRL